MHLVNPGNRRINIVTASITLGLTGRTGLSLIRITPGTGPPITGLVSCNGFGCGRGVGTHRTHHGRDATRVGRVHFHLGVSSRSFSIGGNRIAHFLGKNSGIGIAVVLHNHRVSHPVNNIRLLRHLTSSIRRCNAIRSGPGRRNHGVVVALTPGNGGIRARSRRHHHNTRSHTRHRTHRTTHLTTGRRSRTRTTTSTRSTVSRGASSGGRADGRNDGTRSRGWFHHFRTHRSRQRQRNRTYQFHRTPRPQTRIHSRTP